MKKIVVSGVQTTGNIHLGNYLGSLNNWIKMQNDYNCYFFLADLHSLTAHQSSEETNKSIYDTVAIYLACGLDPDNSTIFKQSDVPEHTELAWLFNCVTPVGWLKRMTQYKDKAGKNQDNAVTGLLTYPLLMAADILLYDADLVPVGADQKQHLELTRDVAALLNRKFTQEIFTLPEPLIQGSATRIMSLKDGTKKMSKSDPSEASRINITDSNDEIVKKIKKAKTDNLDYISYDPLERPDISNLLNIFCAINGAAVSDLVEEYKGHNFSKLKEDLAQQVVALIEPIRDKYLSLISDKAHLDEVLHNGAQKAKTTASKKLMKVKNLFGIA